MDPFIIHVGFYFTKKTDRIIITVWGIPNLLTFQSFRVEFLWLRIQSHRNCRPQTLQGRNQSLIQVEEELDSIGKLVHES